MNYYGLVYEIGYCGATSISLRVPGSTAALPCLPTGGRRVVQLVARPAKAIRPIDPGMQTPVNEDGQMQRHTTAEYLPQVYPHPTVVSVRTVEQGCLYQPARMSTCDRKAERTRIGQKVHPSSAMPGQPRTSWNKAYQAISPGALALPVSRSITYNVVEAPRRSRSFASKSGQLLCLHAPVYQPVNSPLYQLI